jgi:hypothetical protein
MIHILIHVLPNEIDQLEQILLQLKRGSVNIENPNSHFLVDVLLNLNLTKWDESKIPQEFFINKFKQLEKLTQTWASTKFEINTDGSIQGCVSHRRKAFKETQSDALLILDTDIIFSDTLLYVLLHSVNELKIDNQYYILTPQITPMWDHSWDVLVNENYIHESIENNEFRKRDPYNHAKCIGEIYIEPINQFKFGGGWATVISSQLAKYVVIPDSLGHYGLEDTYIMVCSGIMKQKGFKVNQFVIKNEIIVEDHLFRFNPYKDYLVSINKQDEFKKIAHENFEKEIHNFLGLLK